MAVKLRLMRMGKTKQPTYRLVAADSRSPRDGRFIEIVGSYAPREEQNKVVLEGGPGDQVAQRGCSAHRPGPPHPGRRRASCEARSVRRPKEAPDGAGAARPSERPLQPGARVGRPAPFLRTWPATSSTSRTRSGWR